MAGSRSLLRATPLRDLNDAGSLDSQLGDLTEDDLNDVADLLGRSYRALDAFFGRTTPLNLLYSALKASISGSCMP